MSELFDAVDALIASASPLPPPAERERLRKAHGLTQDQVATALKVRRPTVVSWENGKTEPRPPQREAYARLLSQLAELYPANTAAPAPVTAPEAPAPAPAPQALAGPAPATRTAAVTEAAAQPATPAPARPTSTAKPSTSRRPVAKKATPKPAPAAVDPRFANGPLAVVDVADGQVSAYCIGGLILDVPAKTIPALVEWTLSDAQLGAPRLHPLGKDSDPLIVLTAAAAERYGLPVELTDEQRRAGRLPEGHKILKQLEKADWRLTQRGFGPWARIYRPAQNGKRRCVQLSLVSWGALDPREWEHAAQLPPAELARVLGTYATRVMTPRGTSAVNGLELMTALRPASRRVRDERTGEYATDPETGGYLREAIAGSLPETVLQAVPCEVPDGHPLLADLPRFHQRTPAEMLMEEAYDWCRPLTDDECLKSHVVGIDVNMAFAAAANGTTVGLGAPVHVNNPVFDPKMPGSWLVDLSHISFDDRLPSPFTPKGTRPQGPAWYATPTVAYAVELG
ncbi:helix-turn-helix transcriptional regulator, partial [Streptomyces sp. NPDC005407]|uniref:telomere-associated protein Tap n=1 Tax=Streptomyces sp. NPDC005407 TaxID=3155340 RepID=UPI0033ACE121